jgi:hypothetical protein
MLLFLDEELADEGVVAALEPVSGISNAASCQPDDNLRSGCLGGGRSADVVPLDDEEGLLERTEADCGGSGGGIRNGDE